MTTKLTAAQRKALAVIDASADKSAGVHGGTSYITPGFPTGLVNVATAEKLAELGIVTIDAAGTVRRTASE
jgi:hypothetical protein